VARLCHQGYGAGMADGYEALTEKQKQALRLLVAGYDAKSMARHLGLSVYTINERLRDARRKMATSSSREAARLLHQLERNTPEILTDKDFGADPPPPPGESRHHRPIDWRWLIGGTAMLTTLAALALATAPVSAPAPTVPSAAEAATAQVQTARAWLALLDVNDWAASYAGTSAAFKSLNTLAAWSNASRQARTPLGASTGRQLLSTTYAPAPPNGYWVIKFKAQYANRAEAIETVSLEPEGDGWKVVGVTIE
jgi:DNA-binding CsgD family transcriptional regulator